MTANEAIAEAREYENGQAHAVLAARTNGLAAAVRFTELLLYETSYAYAAGYCDEVLWLVSLAEAAHHKRYPTIDAGRRDRLVHAPSRLDEQCAAGMRSRERSY